MPSTSTRRVTTLAVVVMLVLTTTIVIHVSPTTADLDASPPASPLLLERERCGQPDAPAQRARELLAAANAKLNRASFSLEAGPMALADLAEALRCLDASGDLAARRRTSVRLDRERMRLEVAYRARQLRLGLALKHGTRAEAQAESRKLLELLGDRGDAYTAWLQRLSEESAP